MIKLNEIKKKKIYLIISGEKKIKFQNQIKINQLSN